MSDLIREKLDQAVRLVAESDLDVWLTFVRETSETADSVLPFLVEGGLTWQSALMVFSSGRKVAVVGNYDADALSASGHWDEVVPYVKSIREPLIETLARHVEAPRGASAVTIGVNFSTNDVKADGLTHGMYLMLQEYLQDAAMRARLVSAEAVAGSLRSLKTEGEVARIRRAIAETDAIFSGFASDLVGRTEKQVYDFIQARIDESGFGYAWERTGDPIVNSGPNSMVGHGIPSDSISIEAGHIFHVDLGLVVEGYSSDIQRCWYIGGGGETALPSDVREALDAVTGAISRGQVPFGPGRRGGP